MLSSDTPPTRIVLRVDNRRQADMWGAASPRLNSVAAGSFWFHERCWSTAGRVARLVVNPILLAEARQFRR